MDAYFKELKSTLLSNIVFLSLVLYHTGLNQSSLYRASSPAIYNEITANKLNKSVINKIKIIDSQLSFQNPFLVIPFKTTFISLFSNIFHFYSIYFGINYFTIYRKDPFIFLPAYNCKRRWMHRCIVTGSLGSFSIVNWQLAIINY